MDQEDEYGGLFLVSVDDLSTPGLWATTKSLLESRSTLHNLVLHNKLGRGVTVDRLTLQFVASGDKRLQRLRPFAHSPVVWFRLPFAHLLLVSTLDSSEYRNVLKPALKRAIADLEHDWGGPPALGTPPQQPSGMGVLLGGSGAVAAAPVGLLGAEWLIVYVRPPEVDIGDKAAKKVYDKIKDDFSPRGRTRVIRIDPPKGYSAAAVAAMGGCGGVSWTAPRGGTSGVAGGFITSAVLGLEDLELCLRECVRSSFESRQAGYMAEVQRLANERRDPNWSFASLYLVKDSLALLLEGCGLHLEAYKEYVELEAAYQETLDREQQQQGQGQHGGTDLSGQSGNAWDFHDDKFGASGEGAEVATLTSASWRVTRRSLLKRAAVQEFRFRQYLFASQSRLLLRLGRPVDVAERGLRFIGHLAAELGQRERSPTGSVRPLFKEAWTVSACLSVVAAVTASVFGREASPAPPLFVGGIGISGRGRCHSHANSWDVTGFTGGELSGAAPSAVRGARPGNGTEATAAKSMAPRPETQQQPEGASYTLLDEDASVVGADLAGRTAAAAAAAATGHVDWLLWVPFEAEVPSLDPTVLCGQVIAPATLVALRPNDPEAVLRQVTFQGFMLALAHLYSSALSALLRLAQRASQMVHAPAPTQTSPPAADGGGGAEDPEHVEATGTAAAPANDSSSLLAAWRNGLLEIPAQYACHTVVGIFVDQEEDCQFEATPQQQATQLQLLRQAISGQVVAGGTAVAGGIGSYTTVPGVTAAPLSPLQSQGNVTTPRGDSSPANSSGVWLTPIGGAATTSLPELPQPGFWRHNRSDSLYSVSIAGGPTAAREIAGAVGGGDPWDATPQPPSGPAAPTAARSAASSSYGIPPAGRAQMSWMADPELISSTAASTDSRSAGMQRKPHHQHSSSADGASSSFFTKLDVFANKLSSAFDPLKPQRPAGSQVSGLASPPQQVAANTSSASKAMAAREMQEVPTEPLHGGDLGLGSGELTPSSNPALLLPTEIAWLRDWRVRLALSSPSYCADLALHLALAAATCYSRAGRQRAAAQLYGDVGAVLLGRGQAEVVAELMEHVVSLAQAEGWYAVMGRALPVMMAAQQAIGHVMLPYTCVKYLSLPPLACHVDIRRRVLEHVLSSAGCVLGPDGAAKVRRPPLPSAVLQLSTGQAVQAALLPGWSSKFYGTRCASGLPSLVPPARPAVTPSRPSVPPSWYRDGPNGGDVDTAEGEAVDGSWQRQQRRQGRQGRRCTGVGAAQYLRVGDVCSLELQVYSNLPIAVPLSDLQLVLGTLQPTQPLPPPPHSGPNSHYKHHSHHSRHSYTGQLQSQQLLQQQQQLQQSQKQQQQTQHQTHAQSMTQIPTQTAAPAWGRSLSGTSAHPPQQPQRPQRLHPSSFSLVQSSQDHARNLSVADVYGGSGAGHASVPALRVQLGSAVLSGGGGGSAPATGHAVPLPLPLLPPLSAIAAGGPPPHQRSGVTDLNGIHQPAASLEPWAALPSQPTSVPPHLHHVHLHPQQGAAGVSTRVSVSGMSGTAPVAAPSWGSAASSQQQLPVLPNSPTMAAAPAGAAGAAAGPSRLVNTTRGGAAAAGGLERNMSSNTSSSLSLGPTNVGGGGSYSNMSEASGPWRRAPSWPDTLSAAASVSQAAGAAVNGGSISAVSKGGALPDLAGGGAGGLTSPTSTRGGPGPGWAAGDDLPCHHLVLVRHVKDPPGAKGRSGGGGSNHKDAESSLTSSSSAFADSRTVVLQPGLTHLTFRVAPTRPGLYFARHLSASLGSYDLRIPIVPAAQLAADVRALTGGWPGVIGLGTSATGAAGTTAPGGAGSFAFGGLGLGGAALGTAAAIAQLGEVFDGEVRHLEVALQVAPLVPRLLAGPVVVGGALAAGLPQWLGIALAPLDPEPAAQRTNSSTGSDGGVNSDGEEGHGRGSSSGDGASSSSGGNDGGMKYVRVHMQARAQSMLRLGEWFPAPPASTPLGTLSAMPSLASVGGAPSALQAFGIQAACTELPGGEGATAATTGAFSVSSFASPAVAAAAAAAVAATPSFHYHHHNQPGMMSAQPTFRRADGGGQCRVAVIDLQRAAAAATGPNRSQGGSAAATAVGGATAPSMSRGPSQLSATPRPLAAVEGPSPVGVMSNSPRSTGPARVAEAHWTVSSRQGIDLSQALGGPLRSPVLLWLPVWVPPAAPVVGSDDKAPPLDVAPELVRVQQAHGGVASSRFAATAGGALTGRRSANRPGGVALSLNGREGTSGSQHLLPAPLLPPPPPPGHKGSAPGQRPLPPLELEVVVEGLRGGLWRSHATTLSFPLQQPFRMRTTAHQLPDTHVLVSVTVTSCLALPVLVTEVVMEPQYGLMLGTNASTAAGGVGGGHLPSLVPGLLPLRLAPNEGANWAFMLSRSAEALQALPGLHQDDCCLLHMAFCVVPPAGSGLGSTPAAYEVLGPSLQPVSGYRYPLPPLSGPPPGPLPCEGPLTPCLSLTESYSLAPSPGAAGFGHGHGHVYGLLPLPPALPLPPQQQQQQQQHLKATAGPPTSSATPAAVSAPLTVPGHSCPNVYSHNGSYMLPAVPRGCEGLGSGGGHGAAAAMAAGAGFSFTHGFILEFPPSNALTHNLVSVRLLGPHSAVLGQPTHLTWLVTRISSPPAAALGCGAAAADHDADDAAVYEVIEAADAADGGGALPGSSVTIAAVAAAGTTSGGAAAAGGGHWHWRQALGCRGSIRLGRAKGSVAVVEAMLLPVAVGVLRAPALRLRGLREVREEDACSADYVMVTHPTLL